MASMSFSNSAHSSNEEWTNSENKQFENVIAELDLNSPSLLEDIRVKFPGKTVEQIKIHYEKLVEDVLMIERGEIGSANYADENFVVDEVDHKQRRGAPWTDEEHRLFLIGLDKLGKEWVNISKYYVKTKSPSQVASHGNKYFRRLKCDTPLEKRRSSIHDIRIHNSSIVEISARHDPTRHSVITSHTLQHHDDHDLFVSNEIANYSPENESLLQDNITTTNQHSNTNIITNDNDNNNNITNTTPPSTLSTISTTTNNNINAEMMIMGYDINVNDMGYIDEFANHDTILSPASHWFPHDESHDSLPFY